MKGKVAMLIAGLVVGTAGSAFALTAAGRYEVPRGHGATFTGMPKIICLNKALAMGIGHVPKGTAAVLCLSSPTRQQDYYVVFEWNRLRVYNPSDQLVFRAALR